MSQLDNFRKSLGLPNPDDFSADEVKREKAQAKKVVKKAHRTVVLSEETYLRVRGLTVWSLQTYPEKRASADTIITEALQLYLEKNADANAYCKRNLL